MYRRHVISCLIGAVMIALLSIIHALYTALRRD